MQTLDLLLELYERAAKIFYKYFPTLAGLLLLLNAPLFILSEFVVPEYEGVQIPVIGFVSSFVLNTMVMAVLSSIPAISVTYFTAIAESSHKAGLKDTLISTFNKWLIAVVTMALAVLSIFASSLLLIIPGVVVLVYLAFVNQTVVLEKKKFLASLRSSYELVKGRWWSVALSLVVIWFPSMVLSALSYEWSYKLLNSLVGYHYFVPYILNTFIWYFALILVTLYYLALKSKHN